MENPNRNFKSQTCEDFIEVLASKAAVPGGGGASALAGAIGIALGNMVGSLTVGKKTYADVEEEIIECKKQADEIAKEFLELMDKDAEAFEKDDIESVRTSSDDSLRYLCLSPSGGATSSSRPIPGGMLRP